MQQYTSILFRRLKKQKPSIVKITWIAHNNFLPKDLQNKRRSKLKGKGNQVLRPEVVGKRNQNGGGENRFRILTKKLFGTRPLDNTGSDWLDQGFKSVKYSELNFCKWIARA